MAKAKAMTKSALYAHIADETGLKKTEVAGVFDCLAKVIIKELGSKGSGGFTMPGLLKIKAKKVPAKKGGEQKLNPLTGTMYTTKAKPASMRITARAVKAFKEAVK
jgi:nucleoid DNA-binding protein